ncbi:MAG: MFS transporter [Hyphomicrobiales bacterium]|nr:MFS transporter [Hyphomicrobiales bacterium]
MRTLFVIVVVDLIGFGLIIPLLPFFGEHFDASPAAIGLLMASYSLGQFIAAPFWGRMSDRVGRRPVLIWSLTGLSLTYLILAFSTTLWMLFAARTLAGLMAGNIATAFAYVADITKPENRAKGMGLIGAAFGLGFIAGPALGGVLAGPDPHQADFQSPSLLAAGLSISACLLTVLFLPESLPDHARQQNTGLGWIERWQALGTAFATPSVGHILGISFLATFVFAGMEATFALWSRRHFEWGPEQNGYVFAFIGIISALIQGGLLGRLARRFGEHNLVTAGAAALCIGMLLIPFATTVRDLLLIMVVVGTGFSLISPSLTSLLSLHTDVGMQGGMMGVSRSAVTLARVLGPACAGAVFYSLGKDWPFIVGSLVMAGVFIFSFYSRPYLCPQMQKRR